MLLLFAVLAGCAPDAPSIERPPIVWGDRQRVDQDRTMGSPTTGIVAPHGYRRPDPARGREDSLQKCREGDRAGCIAAGQIHPLDADVRVRLATFCAAGDALACIAHGEVASLVRACDLGWVEGCTRLTNVAGEDAGYWAQRACAAGGRCDIAEQILHRARRHPERLRLHEALCPTEPRHCSKAAAMLDQGLGAPQDLPGAFARFERACAAGGDRDACCQVVARLRDGVGTTADPVAAASKLAALQVQNALACSGRP